MVERNQPLTKQKERLNQEPLPQIWDNSTQQFHGGQDWKFIKNFREDFSVTTNGLGTPKAALKAAQEALMTIDHYPPANQEPALSSLANFMFPESHVDEKQKLILGNGASELIDLVIRSSPSGPWRPGPSLVQYMEYERSATSHGRQILKIPTDSFAPSKPASVYSLVNPTNPTGDYMSIDKLKQWICDNVSHGATVTVDESMQLWVGPNWRSDSLLSQSKWISEMWTSRQIAIYVIHSWTKIWACTGIRLGSIWCPSIKHCVEMKRIQVPWSVNTPALAFLDAVVRDEAYLKQTWEVTPQWNKYAISCLNSLAHSKGFEWTLHGFDRLSWIWIDMKSVNCAEKAVLLAKEAGVPVRSGKPGYEKPEFVRIAVRERLLTDILIKAWEKL